MENWKSEDTPDGQELLNLVISLTGLPESDVQKDLEPIFERNGQGPANLTLDQLREVLAAYLETVCAEALGEPASVE